VIWPRSSMRRMSVATKPGTDLHTDSSTSFNPPTLRLKMFGRQDISRAPRTAVSSWQLIIFENQGGKRSDTCVVRCRTEVQHLAARCISARERLERDLSIISVLPLILWLHNYGSA
jgi:hypothetical protein